MSKLRAVLGAMKSSAPAALFALVLFSPVALLLHPQRLLPQSKCARELQVRIDSGQDRE